MSCYHPRTIRVISDFETGEAHFIYSLADGHLADADKGEFAIPCGECIGCRLDKSRTWADRMMLELDHSKSGVFVTLTYDEDHVHPAWTNSKGEIFYTLDKRDFQLFMKRLRSRFYGKKIRFYLCGEYGSVTQRPHGHAILFGLSLEDFPDLMPVGTNEFKQLYYSSDLLADVWQNGFVSLSAVSWQTCAYVARYVQKKAFKDDKLLTPDERGVLPEFSLMSRKPGIGGYYHLDHPDVFDSQSIFISDPNGVKPGSKKISVPKYVFRHLQEIDPDLYYQIKEDRQKFARDRELLALQETDLDILSYYQMAEQKKLASAKKLLRKEL